jgi:hypothetical protein
MANLGLQGLQGLRISYANYLTIACWAVFNKNKNIQIGTYSQEIDVNEP